LRTYEDFEQFFNEYTKPDGSPDTEKIERYVDTLNEAELEIIIRNNDNIMDMIHTELDRRKGNEDPN
jgi:hypothetical protein